MLHAKTSKASELTPNRPESHLKGATKLSDAFQRRGQSSTGPSLAHEKPVNPLVSAQRIYGNQATLRLLNHSTNTPARVLRGKCGCDGLDCPQCKGKKDESISRKGVADGTEPNAVPAIVHEVLRSPGEPLDKSTREYMQAQLAPRLSRSTGAPVIQKMHVGPEGDRYELEADQAADRAMNQRLSKSPAAYDFAQVRVHRDTRAAESARAINALAYTAGNDIVFGTAQYAPETTRGRTLIAHELAHVVQQGSGTSRPAGLVQRQPEDKKPAPKDETKPAPATTRTLSKTTVPGSVEGDCGAYSWTIQWSIDNAAGPKGGFVVQGLKVDYDVKDCDGKAVNVHSETLSEAWPINAGKKVSKWAETGDVNDDTYTDPSSGKKTKGSIKVVASAAYYDGITLPADFKENNPKTQSGILPSTDKIVSLAGGTASIAHNLTATWDCCPNKADKTKVTKT